MAAENKSAGMAASAAASISEISRRKSKLGGNQANGGG